MSCPYPTDKRDTSCCCPARVYKCSMRTVAPCVCSRCIPDSGGHADGFGFAFLWGATLSTSNPTISRALKQPPIAISMALSHLLANNQLATTKSITLLKQIMERLECDPQGWSTPQPGGVVVGSPVLGTVATGCGPAGATAASRGTNCSTTRQKPHTMGGTGAHHHPLETSARPSHHITHYIIAGWGTVHPTLQPVAARALKCGGEE